jgi:hypothetical protein
MLAEDPHTSDVRSAYERLLANGVQATPPFDHGFAIVTRLEDADGNNVQLMTPME